MQNCGALARTHARGGDSAAICGYVGKSQVLDTALATWGEAYTEQTEWGHDNLVKGIKSDRIQAIQGV